MYAEIFGKLYTDSDDYDNQITVEGEQLMLSGEPIKYLLTPNEYAIYQLLCTVAGKECSKQVVLDHVVELTNHRRLQCAKERMGMYD